MRHSSLLLLSPLALALGTCGELRAEVPPPAIPAALPADRYRPLWTRSPFTVASASEAEASGEWMVAGIAQNGSHPLVFLVNRQNQEQMTVTDQPNEKGYSVASLDTRADLLQSSVQLKTPSDTVTVKFDAAAVAAVAAPPPTPVAVQQPGMPGLAPGGPGSERFNTVNGERRRRIMPRVQVPNPLAPGQPQPQPGQPQPGAPVTLNNTMVAPAPGTPSR